MCLWVWKVKDNYHINFHIIEELLNCHETGGMTYLKYIYILIFAQNTLARQLVLKYRSSFSVLCVGIPSANV